ncbi:hypothetical protein POM88_038122 [Heracleum sosnowskyi]|uniref:Uncharacterized protein n=1 Tax=Heracleum sosnowskyi TaxID=360622 RepID=A0AAD8MDW4_9APIA|nr:hypothetical protein POM88_038122 [Heracleum sosnowskyi]
MPNQEDESCFIVEGGKEAGEEKMGLDELGVVFFEWQKNNKEHFHRLQSRFVLPPQYNSFPDQNGIAPTPQPFAPVYGDQHPAQIYNGNNGVGPVRLGAFATKEARKKRMARQRRCSLYHYRHHPHQNQH